MVAVAAQSAAGPVATAVLAVAQTVWLDQTVLEQLLEAEAAQAHRQQEGQVERARQQTVELVPQTLVAMAQTETRCSEVEVGEQTSAASAAHTALARRQAGVAGAASLAVVGAAMGGRWRVRVVVVVVLVS